MAKNHRRIIAPLSDKIQRVLVGRFLSQCQIPEDNRAVYCKHLTYAYKVGQETPFPTGEIGIEVVGVYHDTMASVLLCCLRVPILGERQEFTGYNYQLLRPDGEFFHITLAVKGDMMPHQGLQRVRLDCVDWLIETNNGATNIAPLLFTSRLHMGGLKVDTPQLHTRMSA